MTDFSKNAHLLKCIFRQSMHKCIGLKLIQIWLFCVSAEITTVTTWVTKQELSVLSTRIPVSEGKSRSYKVKATNKSVSSKGHNCETISPPPTAPGATLTTLAVSSIQTRSAGQRTTSNSQHKCSLQITSA